MAEVKESGILIQDVETKNIMTKSTLPVGGYSVNPYVGCTHGCKYCYASFMKRFTGHTEPWGTFLDVKHWPAIKNPQKYKGQRVVHEGTAVFFRQPFRLILQTTEVASVSLVVESFLNSSGAVRQKFSSVPSRIW